MTEIKGNLRFLQLPPRYLRNTVAELFLNTYITLCVDVSSSDICDKDRKKRDDARSISKEECGEFIMVQTLSRSNNPTPSVVVLC
jgi:hypothetical protein